MMEVRITHWIYAINIEKRMKELRYFIKKMEEYVQQETKV